MKLNYLTNRRLVRIDIVDIGSGSGTTVQGASCAVEHRASTSATNETGTDDTHGSAAPADDRGRPVCDGGTSDIAKMAAGSEQQPMETDRTTSGQPEKHKSSSKKGDDSEADLELKR